MDALLLDYNGVVVDDEPLHFVALRDILAAEGVALDETAYYEGYVGSDDRAAFAKAFRKQGRELAPEAVRTLVARKAERYAALAGDALALVPGVTAFVREAADHVFVAVVSGALRSEIETGLRKAHLQDVVRLIVSAEDVTTTKPDPEGFRLALARLAALRPGRAWRVAVIEDSLPGLAAARAIGAGCLMLTTSYDAGTLAGADLTWDTFEGHAPRELQSLWRPVEVGP
jgi:beta-phosphoglucomutase